MSDLITIPSELTDVDQWSLTAEEFNTIKNLVQDFLISSEVPLSEIDVNQFQQAVSSHMGGFKLPTDNMDGTFTVTVGVGSKYYIEDPDNTAIVDKNGTVIPYQSMTGGAINPTGGPLYGNAVFIDGSLTMQVYGYNSFDTTGQLRAKYDASNIIADGLYAALVAKKEEFESTELGTGSVGMDVLCDVVGAVRKTFRTATYAPLNTYGNIPTDNWKIFVDSDKPSLSVTDTMISLDGGMRIESRAGTTNWRHASNVIRGGVLAIGQTKYNLAPWSRTNYSSIGGDLKDGLWVSGTGNSGKYLLGDHVYMVTAEMDLDSKDVSTFGSNKELFADIRVDYVYGKYVQTDMAITDEMLQYNGDRYFVDVFGRIFIISLRYRYFHLDTPPTMDDFENGSLERDGYFLLGLSSAIKESCHCSHTNPFGVCNADDSAGPFYTTDDFTRSTRFAIHNSDGDTAPSSLVKMLRPMQFAAALTIPLYKTTSKMDMGIYPVAKQTISYGPDITVRELMDSSCTYDGCYLNDADGVSVPHFKIYSANTPNTLVMTNGMDANADSVVISNLDQVVTPIMTTFHGYNSHVTTITVNQKSDGYNKDAPADYMSGVWPPSSDLFDMATTTIGRCTAIDKTTPSKFGQFAMISTYNAQIIPLFSMLQHRLDMKYGTIPTNRTVVNQVVNVSEEMIHPDNETMYVSRTFAQRS